uniref:SUZ domain-containing protein n=1 Tax=Mesocestoides corti TaxID=53468 RepID=A0A5K3FYF3_MESCO
MAKETQSLLDHFENMLGKMGDDDSSNNLTSSTQPAPTHSTPTSSFVRDQFLRNTSSDFFGLNCWPVKNDDRPTGNSQLIASTSYQPSHHVNYGVLAPMIVPPASSQAFCGQAPCQGLVLTKPITAPSKRISSEACLDPTTSRQHRIFSDEERRLAKRRLVEANRAQKQVEASMDGTSGGQSNCFRSAPQQAPPPPPYPLRLPPPPPLRPFSLPPRLAAAAVTPAIAAPVPHFHPVHPLANTDTTLFMGPVVALPRLCPPPHPLYGSLGFNGTSQPQIFQRPPFITSWQNPLSYQQLPMPFPSMVTPVSERQVSPPNSSLLFHQKESSANIEATESLPAPGDHSNDETTANLEFVNMARDIAIAYRVVNVPNRLNGYDASSKTENQPQCDESSSVESTNINQLPPALSPIFFRLVGFAIQLPGFPFIHWTRHVFFVAPSWTS